jgi:hypothetical protein
MYWTFQTRIYVWRNQHVQAKLIHPSPHALVHLYGELGFQSPRQTTPYGIDLDLTYQVDPRHPHPDNHYENAGFALYSQRLVELMRSFDVEAEVFPVTTVARAGAPLDLNYCVFHSLEGIIDAMDEVQSEWTGDLQTGVSRLVLDPAKFEHRPMFVCDKIYLPLMRDDLKQAIQRQGITGFAFLEPEWYHSVDNGFPPEFHE